MIVGNINKQIVHFRSQFLSFSSIKAVTYFQFGIRFSSASHKASSIELTSNSTNTQNVWQGKYCICKSIQLLNNKNDSYSYISLDYHFVRVRRGFVPSCTHQRKVGRLRQSREWLLCLGQRWTRLR